MTGAYSVSPAQLTAKGWRRRETALRHIRARLPVWRVGPNAPPRLAVSSRRVRGVWLSAGAWGLFSRPWGMRGSAWRRPERRRGRGGLGLKG